MNKREKREKIRELDIDIELMTKDLAQILMHIKGAKLLKEQLQKEIKEEDKSNV